MQMKRPLRYAAHGFTIVELLIVVVVIGILASITIVSYGNVVARARDSVRLDHANQIVDALYLYANTHGDFMGTATGCGRYGNGVGWFNRGSAIDKEIASPDYPRAIVDCLVDEKLISIDVGDPTGLYAFSMENPDGKYSYMKYNCSGAASVVFVFIKLETQSAADRMDPNGVCEGETNSHAIQAIGAYESYKMNYYIKVSDS